jgi:tetratricopeptide (TPR) repeat protein
MNRQTCCVFAIALLACSAAAAAEMSPERQRQVLREAQTAFDQAVELSQSQPAQAQELYRQSAAGFSALVEAGVHNAALEYNLGNAYFRLDELGQAILHYGRAQQLDPSDQKTSANLEYARGQVEPAIERSGQDRLVRSLLFLHYDTAVRSRFFAAVGLSIAGWFLLGLRLRWPRRGFLVAGGVAVAVGLSFAASVAWQVREDGRHPRAVLVGSPTVLRLGRGEAYDPALQQPLGPGVEMRVLQQRGDWAEVRLANDQTGWLPSAALDTL